MSEPPFLFTRLTNCMLGRAILYADEYHMSGSGAYQTAEKLSQAGLVIIVLLSDSKKRIRFSILPTARGRRVWNDHQRCPAWKPRGGPNSLLSATVLINTVNRVIDAGSIAGAAKALGLTKDAVDYRLSVAKQRLGLQIDPG